MDRMIAAGIRVSSSPADPDMLIITLPRRVLAFSPDGTEELRDALTEQLSEVYGRRPPGPDDIYETEDF